MPKHEADNQHMGYFLPEDGQARLAKLKAHMEFLSRLAQPRTADEEREWAPEVRTGELAACLALLAEQAERVLAAMSWLPARQAVASTAEGDDGHDAGHARGEDEEEEAREDENEDAPEVVPEPSDATGRPLVYGLTVAQSDELDRLVQTIAAHGDVLAMGDPDDLAEGTVQTLAQAIHDAAIELREILDQLGAQRLVPLPPALTGVREEPAAYLAYLAIPAADDASGSELPLPAFRQRQHVGPPRNARLH